MSVPRLKLSPEGPEVSRQVYGVWRILDLPDPSPQQALEIIETCLELGITTFDHSDIYGGYGCEEHFGKALALKPELKQKIEIITKCDIMLVDPARPDNRIKHYNTSKEHIIASAERSLKNLGVEQLDVLLLHRPDPLMDADEVAEAFGALKVQGKILHAGVSNFTTHQFALLRSRMPLVTNQLEIHLLRPESLLDGTLDQCQQHRIAPMAWSPTGGGQIFTGADESTLRVRAALEEVAGKYNAGIDQILYAWLNRHPAGIITVLGSGKLDRIRSAAAAFAIELERQDWFTLWSAAIGGEVP